MPVSASTDAERGIVTLQFTGDTSFAELKSVMDGVLKDADDQGGLCILSDRRLARNVPTTDDVRLLLSYLMDHAVRFDPCGIAVVVSSAAQFGMSRMLELMADGTGVRLRSFYSADDALAWLKES